MSLPLKMICRLRQVVKYGPSHVGQVVPIGHVFDNNEINFTTPTSIHKVIYVFPTPCQYKIRHTSI